MVLKKICFCALLLSLFNGIDFIKDDRLFVCYYLNNVIFKRVQMFKLCMVWFKCQTLLFQLELLIVRKQNKIKWSYKLNWINQCDSLVLLSLTLKFYKEDTSNHIHQTG